MSGILHKDLTGADLHINKLHADTHTVAGTDPLVLAESQIADLVPDLAGKVDEGDARLTDARTPIAHVHSEDQVTDLVSDLAGKAPTVHTHTKSQITDFPVIPDYPELGTSAVKDVPASGDATVDQVVKGDDTRLADTRTPKTHTHGKVDITDFPASMPASDVSEWAKAADKPSYAYSEITTPPTLGTAAAKNIPATGNAAATEVVYGSDTRLADARTPSSHTHLLAAGATDVTATAAELNVLDGVTATAAELNYTDGVTSAIQGQVDAKLPIAGGTLTGVLEAQANTSYTTRQVHNIVLSTSDASGGSNGDIWIKYTA